MAERSGDRLPDGYFRVDPSHMTVSVNPYPQLLWLWVWYEGDWSVTDVCLAVGCTSLGSFSARFTQVVGETPTAYRAGDHGALVSVPGCIAKELTRPTPMPSRIGEARATAAR